MGLIRKTLAVGTIGCVSGSSKKQRVAKAQLNELRAIRTAIEGPQARHLNLQPRAAQAQHAALKAQANERAREHNAAPSPERWAAYIEARRYAEARGVIFNR